ncbi:dual specificity protein phosphatase [Leishmania donovani]|nr:dual specificity protein phosphatase [Leishmania donovani]
MGVLCGSANSRGGRILAACADTNCRSNRELSRCRVDSTHGKRNGCAQHNHFRSSAEVGDANVSETILSASTIHISRVGGSGGAKRFAGAGADTNSDGVGHSPTVGSAAGGSVEHGKVPQAPGTAPPKSQPLHAAADAALNGHEQQQLQRGASSHGTSREASVAPQKLSARALRIASRVDSIVRKCEGLDAERPTEEEKVMCEVLDALRSSSVGLLFLNHPEVSFSNRSCVICIPDFHQDETIDGYRLRAAYNAGTIGRSYFATRDVAALSSRCTPPHGSSDSLSDDAARGPVFRILKVISFVLRRRLLEEITAEQRVLVNIVHQNVLQISDVLNDEAKENMIVITNYHAKGNIGNYAGRLSHDSDKLRRILTEVAVGLRILHSHRVYHHNLKLDNVLENGEGHFCIADAGFWRLFAVQCPEDLVFNGELACLPPEVFDPEGPYATGEVNVVSDEGAAGVAAVDIWGFGVLMYRLAYGCDPIEIAECSYAQVHERLMGFDLSFPPRPHWSFAYDIEDAIRLCLQKVPSKRPSVLRLLQHPFFKHSLVVGTSSLMRKMSMTSSFAFGGQMVGSFGDRTMSAPGLRGASMSSMAVPNYRTQQRNGFQVDAFLGEGRFSETMMVHLRRNHSKQFAFKIIYKSILKRLQAPGREKWAREMRRQLVFSRKVDHPNVMRFIDIVEDKKVNCFVVQDYMSGGSIEAVPPVKGDSSSPTLQDFLVDVLAGLVHLHDNGVAHLSLLPTNIFFCEHTLHYCIADFGPLFVTADALADSIAEGAPLYALPAWVRRHSPLHGPSVDMFCVGLLAASVLPELFDTVWAELLDSEKNRTFAVDAVLTAVRKQRAQLTPALVSFIEDALEGRFQDARAALKHTYFGNLSFAQNLPKTIVEVTEEELQSAVHSKPETRDEARMLEVLAQDPFQESQMLSSAGDATLHGSESCTEASVIAGATGEKPTVLVFEGENLLCGQCSAELTVALYQCSDCDGYIRCGKCSVGNYHKDGHELVPFLIHTIEHSRDGANKAVLVQPSTVPDVHALETLEMTANFPVGSLTAHLVAQRAAERSIAVRSTGGGSITKGMFGDMESVVRLPDDISEQSISVNINCRSFISFRGLGGMPGGGLNLGSGANNSNTGFNTVGFPHGRADPVTPKDFGSLCLPPPTRLSLMKGKEARKLVLPKAEEIEDDDWQQELERCRTSNHSELLLYNYGLDEVPPEVYDPPLLQVVVLDISQNNLRSLPHELSFLIHLRKLVVSYNKLTELPDSLGNLSELESLDASHNALVDLPQTFIYLSSLTSAALDYNNFSSIPDSLLDIVAPPLCSSASNVMENFAMSTTQVNGARMASLVGNTAVSLVGGSSVSNSKTVIMSPKLKVIYLAANDSLTTLPLRERLQRFDDLTIALDNEPSLYKDYYEKSLDTELPNITVNWNKLYPDEIVPYLYCGSLRSAQSQMVYRKLNITYLLTVGRQLVPVPPEGGHHKVIVVDDIPGANIRMSFQEAVNFIEESQSKKSGCLVHCFAGLSRSATTVIAYLMIKRGMRLDEAYLVTKKGRPAILPNKGFFDQLVELDKELYPKPNRPLDIESLGRSAN